MEQQTVVVKTLESILAHLPEGVSEDVKEFVAREWIDKRRDWSGHVVAAFDEGVAEARQEIRQARLRTVGARVLGTTVEELESKMKGETSKKETK